MQYSLALAALAASTLTMAAPAPEIFGRDSFSVSQVATGKKVYKHGATDYQRALVKHNKPVPANVQSAAAAAQTGSAPANPESYDEAYLVPVTAGSSKVNLDFDTGSSDLWVYGSATPKSQSSGHDLYTPSSSGTKKSGYSWQISYGDGSGASGIVYSDKVVVGGVTATSQAVEVATKVSSQFSDDKANDGLLGLAFSSLNTVTPKQQTTFFDTVKSTLAKPLFTVALKKGRAGTYDFGYIDSSKYTGSITYVPVDNSQGFWGFTAGNGIGSSIADTGTTLLLITDAATSAYYAKVPSASYDNTNGGYTFPCSTTLPDYVVKIGAYTATIPGSFINYSPTDDSGTTCFGGIQSAGSEGISIFGDIFLKSQFVVFDETTSSPRLGFAKPSSL